MKPQKNAPVSAIAKAPAPSPKTTLSRRTPTHEEISNNAKAIWEKAGRPQGKDTLIWLEAERRLSPEAGLSDSDKDAFADTRALMGEPTDSIEDRLRPYGEQTGDRSATSL
jgi:hypothetical protein